MHRNLIFHLILDREPPDLKFKDKTIRQKKKEIISEPVIKLEVINGRISILSIRISMSPGKERIIMVSEDGFDKRQRNPSNRPKKTPAMVNVSRRLFRSEPQQLLQH